MIIMKNSGLLFLSIFFAVMGYSQPSTFEWAYECGSPPNTTDTKTTLATGEDGVFYLAGEFNDTADFGNLTVYSEGGSDVFLVKHDNLGNALWASRIGSADEDYVQGVKEDGAGNVVVTGYFYGTTLIGDDAYTSFGSQDLFIARFDSQGEFLWSERAGGIMADYISSMDIDAANNVIITGYFYGEMAIGDTTIYASSSSDIYLAKYSPEGDLLWVITAGGISSDQSRAVSCDPDGNIFLSGSYYYNFTVADTMLVTDNPVGVVIVGFQPDGQLLRVFQLEGTYLSPEVYIKCDYAGDFYIAGNFSEDIFFGSKTFSAGEFNQDIFAAKYNEDGSLAWANHGTSFSSDQVIGIDTDPYNNLYIAGHYLDTLQFGLLTLPYTLCCGSREIFIVNYSFDGKVQWVNRVTGVRASVQSVAMDDAGALILSGMFIEDLIFGPITLSNFTDYRNYITRLETDMYTNMPDQSHRGDDLQIYPNPVIGNINIGGLPSADPILLRIYNLNGNLIHSFIYTPSSPVSVEDLKPGIYFVLAEDVKRSSIFSGKFVKL